MSFSQADIVDIFKIEHEITFKNMEAFQYNMDRFLVKSRKFLILDLHQVMYLNNAAIGIIAHAAMKAQKIGKELVVTGVISPLSEIFEIIRFNDFMRLFADYDQAIEYFQAKYSISNRN